MFPFLIARALMGLQPPPSAGAPTPEPSLGARTSRGQSEAEWRAAMKDLLLYGNGDPPVTETILAGLEAVNQLGPARGSRARSLPNRAYRGAVGPPTRRVANRPFWLTTSGERAGFFAQRQAGMSPHYESDLASETAGMVGNPQVQQWALAPQRPKVFTQGAYHAAMRAARSRSRTGQEELHATLAKQGHDVVYIKNDDGTWDMAVLRPDAIRPKPFGAK